MCLLDLHGHICPKHRSECETNKSENRHNVSVGPGRWNEDSEGINHQDGNEKEYAAARTIAVLTRCRR